MVLKAGTSFECLLLKGKSFPRIQNVNKAVQGTEGRCSLAHPCPASLPRPPCETPTFISFLDILLTFLQANTSECERGFYSLLSYTTQNTLFPAS